MFTLKQIGTLAACCMLSFAAPARAESASQYRWQFGDSAEGGRVDREIVVTANTRWINVMAGQVIRFVVPGAAGANASFTWHFDAFSGGVADLSRLAPEAMALRSINIYIAKDSHYSGS